MSHRLVLGACCSRKFWDLSAISEEEWTKGGSVHHKRRKTTVIEGKRKKRTNKEGILVHSQIKDEEQPRGR
jgi:hypothetical protein